MRSKRRLIAALAVALMCAPGTWLRSDVPRGLPSDIAVTAVAGPRALGNSDWELGGVWQYQANSLRFGGFSALLALGSGRLRTFSDRGFRMIMTEPDREAPRQGMNRQLVEPGREWDLWDIEAATRNPANGDYWLGYEHRHAIHRFTAASIPDGVRDLREEVDWPSNSGIEAMVRLEDGRFVVLPEGQPRGLLFAQDPVEGGTPATFTITSPAKGYVITGAKQLPDGRLMVLMRRLVWPSPRAWPPFASLLAIGELPSAGGAFAPDVALRLEGVLPRDNYEGLALRERADGRIDVWIISDDNFSVFQRTLLAKLIYTP